MTRQREIVKIDVRSGEITTFFEVLADASFEQRVAELVAKLGSIGPGSFANVRCDGCNATMTFELLAPKLPEGWVTTPEGELCPNCKEARISEDLRS